MVKNNLNQRRPGTNVLSQIANYAQKRPANVGKTQTV